MHSKVVKSEIILTGFLVLGACLSAFILWWWWTSFDSPNPFPRPHGAIWEPVSLALRSEGQKVELGTQYVDDKLSVRLCAWTYKTLGHTYRSLVAGQLPFLFLLVISSAFLGLRYGGKPEAALAAFIAAFAPMSVGLAVHFDEWLTFQATLSLIAALMAWSKKGLRFLSLFIPIPFLYALHSWVYISNRMIFFTFFLTTVASFLCGLFLEETAFNKRRATWFPKGLLIVLAVCLVSFFIGLQTVELSKSTYYFKTQSFRPDIASLSALVNSKMFLSCPLAWYRIHAGPTLAVVTFVSLGLMIGRKKIVEVLPFLGWLLVPMLVLSVMAKRNEFYLAAVIPATYPLAALGVGAFKRMSFKAGYFLIVVTLLANQWFSNALTLYRNQDYKDLVPYFELEPFPYLYSPYSHTRSPDKELGEWAAEVCGPSHLALVFFNDEWASNEMMFAARHHDPALMIQDFQRQEGIDFMNSCIVTNIPKQGDVGDVLDAEAVAEMYRLKDSYQTKHPKNFEKLILMQGHYRIVSKKIIRDHIALVGPHFIYLPVDRTQENPL